MFYGRLIAPFNIRFRGCASFSFTCHWCILAQNNVSRGTIDCGSEVPPLRARQHHFDPGIHSTHLNLNREIIGTLVLSPCVSPHTVQQQLHPCIHFSLFRRLGLRPVYCLLYKLVLCPRYVISSGYESDRHDEWGIHLDGIADKVGFTKRIGGETYSITMAF